MEDAPLLRNHFSDPFAPDVVRSKHDRISYMAPRDMVSELDGQMPFSDFMLTWVGYYERAVGISSVANRTDPAYPFPDYVFHYSQEGSGFLRTGDGFARIGGGDLFICHAGFPHHYGSDRDDPWSVYWACFRGKQAEPLLAMLGLTRESPVVNLGVCSELIETFYRIFDALRGGVTPETVLMASGQLFALITLLIARRARLKESMMPGFSVEVIVSLMYRNLAYPRDLNYFAAAAGMSRHAFDRKFRLATGYSPINYFNRLKIQKACELLIMGNMTVKEISSGLGFSNPNYFSERFRQMMGYTPLGYRAAFRKI